MSGLRMRIDQTWDGNPIEHRPTEIELGWKYDRRATKRAVTVEFSTHLNDDPEPPSGVGICPQLWDYEVFELFFANDRDQYLEVEVGPHGHWLCLLLDGYRKPFNQGEDLELRVTNAHTLEGGEMVWKGTMEIPLGYFPPNITKMNAYKIHGVGDERVYEALSPVTDGTVETPDFHRLEFFRDLPSDDFNVTGLRYVSRYHDNSAIVQKTNVIMRRLTPAARSKFIPASFVERPFSGPAHDFWTGRQT